MTNAPSPRPFLVSAVGGGGLSRRQARHSSLAAPSRGLRLLGEVNLRRHVEAVTLVLPEGGVFCGPTAGLLLGLPVPYRLADGPVWVMVPEGAARTRRRGVRSRQADITHSEIAAVDGLPVTSPARTFVDLAAHLSLPDLVALGDDVLRRGRTSREEIDAVIRRRVRYPGKVAARSALPLLDHRAESPQESRLRVHIVGSGLPAPSVNLVIRDPSGGFLARCDLGYEDWRVAVEYDGAAHAAEDRRTADATRRTLLRENGWYVVEIVAPDLRIPARAVRKVEAALRASGWVPGAS